MSGNDSKIITDTLKWTAETTEKLEKELTLLSAEPKDQKSLTNLKVMREQFHKLRDLQHGLENLQPTYKGRETPQYLKDMLEKASASNMKVLTDDPKLLSCVTYEAKLLGVENDLHPYPDIHWIFTIILDWMMYYAFMGTRDYNIGFNGMVTHFYSWNLITDFIGYTLPPMRRHWFTPFRFLTAFSLLQSSIWLWYAGVDELAVLDASSMTASSFAANNSLSIIASQTESSFIVSLLDTPTNSNWRIAMSFFVMLHAAIYWYMFGPYSSEEVISLLKFNRAAFNLSNSFIARFSTAPVFFAILTLFGAELMYRNVYNYGMTVADATITSFEATSAITVLFKYYIYQNLVGDLTKRIFVTAIIFICFISQWYQNDMFEDATIPSIHILGDLYFLIELFFYVVMRFKQDEFNSKPLVVFRHHKDGHKTPTLQP